MTSVFDKLQQRAVDQRTGLLDITCYVGLQIFAFLITIYVRNYVTALSQNDDERYCIDLLLICAGIRTFRQCYWRSVLYKWHLGFFAVIWALLDVITDCASIWVASTEFYSLRQIGFILFIIGCFIETFHDTHRTLWINHHKGKLYKYAFAKYVVYPNYFGYILWNAGRGLMTGNFIFTLSVTGMHLFNFISHSIPDAYFYGKKKYGKEFEKYYDKTSKLIPFIY